MPDRKYVGRCVDPKGQPIAGARVYSWTDSKDSAGRRNVCESVTGEDGRFEIVAGDWHWQLFAAEAPGFAPNHWSRRAQRRGLGEDLGDLRLVPGATITGRALGPDGRPIPITEVETRSSRRSGVPKPRMSERPSSDGLPEGSVVVGPLGPGWHSVTVRAAGFGDVTKHATIVPGDLEQSLGEFAFRPEVLCSGRVVDEAGHGIVGAEVTVDSQHARRVRTDREGVFHVQGQSAPKYGVARASGYRESSVRLDGQRGPVKITLAREWEVAGRVVDWETGEPIAEAEVLLLGVHRRPDGYIDEMPLGSDWEAARNGAFRCSYGFVGERQLSVRAKDYESEARFLPPRLMVEKEEEVVVRLKRLMAPPSDPPLTRVTGLIPEAERCSGARVSAWYSVREPTVMNVTTLRGCPVAVGGECYETVGVDASGAFELSLPSSRWVFALESSHRDVALGFLEFEPGRVDAELVFDHGPSGSIEGVVEGLVGTAWHSIYVVAFGNGIIRRETPVQEDGSYLLAGLPAGRYALRAGYEGLSRGGFVSAEALKRPEERSEEANLRVEKEIARSSRDAEPAEGASVAEVKAGEITSSVNLTLRAP